MQEGITVALGANGGLGTMSRIDNRVIGQYHELGHNAVYQLPVASTGEIGPTNAVAELTIGCLISLLRNIPSMDHALHRGKWEKKIGTELSGSRIAVIGYGRIGQRVGQLLGFFGARVIAVDPFEKEMPADVTAMSLTDALPVADVVTIHCSGEEQIMGEKEFGLIKPGVFLLNAARGGVVDQEALIVQLESGRVAGAWIDTFAREPYKGSLCRFQQVILTPHVGSYTLECRRKMEMEAVENLFNGFGIR